ncbi:type I restriction-modification system subunit M [Rhodoferax antarcticus]|uniref:site-specific DNA-methyltransferase (adenine-specific) n=1 Tax=Rhodoferax antarcticus ANT.BR TaxID=1111071 RepID=A0A1Q8YK86_9BURK|nr:class I SAM-dependent DNA methyltransferase [Rhodoferax antarcticus]APW47335.1 restriction endonuclease subunit M [Rhodoferax antarcticus]OLP08432.1 N-6 DNA methylase family protein [Rhodoferax antarcticus ANT.BR]
MATSNLSSFIWSVADLLRGDYKQSEYGKVILPFTVLRRLDCVLESTKAAVLAEKTTREAAGLNPEPFLLRKAGQLFYNTSPLDLKKLMGDQDHIGENLRAYLQAFSPAVRDIFESFEFHVQIDKLAKSGLLYMVTEKFANIDLHPDVVSNNEMGAVFEELIRKFAELSNETAGEHFTPREVIRLMVNLLFIEDDAALTKPGVVRSLYDPTAGTGGMLSVAGEHLASLNPDARLVMYGQELNPESYAICKADMLIKGQDIANIIFGNTLSNDGLNGKVFDYSLSNPPFGVEWKKIEALIRKEFETQGFDGRFGPGLPRVSDGSLLFLLHLISKMRPSRDGGSRFGIVLNGSPLFTGGAGSGESEIRRYVLENDLVEAIIGLPTDMFYNTGISTYVWIVSNRKPATRKGKLQLIDASSFWQKMRKSLGSKRKELSPTHIDDITRLFGNFEESTQGGVPISRIFKNEAFGYRTITVERPERDAGGKVVLGLKGKGKGKPMPDSSLRDTENVPLGEDVEAYFKREVLPHAPDAWIDHDKTKVGYEIPFNRHFYVFKPPRPLAEIDAELKGVTDRILTMIGGLTA